MYHKFPLGKFQIWSLLAGQESKCTCAGLAIALMTAGTSFSMSLFPMAAEADVNALIAAFLTYMTTTQLHSAAWSYTFKYCQVKHEQRGCYLQETFLRSLLSHGSWGQTWGLASARQPLATGMISGRLRATSMGAVLLQPSSSCKAPTLVCQFLLTSIASNKGGSRRPWAEPQEMLMKAFPAVAAAVRTVGACASRLLLVVYQILVKKSYVLLTTPLN